MGKTYITNLGRFLVECFNNKILSLNNLANLLPQTYKIKKTMKVTLVKVGKVSTKPHRNYI